MLEIISNVYIQTYRYMNTYRLFIGENNYTHVLEDSKARSIVNKYFEGYTYTLTSGVWKGKTESTLVVEIATDERQKIQELSREICVELQQDAVMVTEIGVSQFVTA